MRAAKRLYYENVRVGDELPPSEPRLVDRVAIARWAGATHDFGPLHVDETYARRAGFPGTFAHGTLLLGLVGRLASEWLAGGQLRRISTRFVKIVWPGDELVCRGRVTDKRREGGDYYVDLDLWVENQKGELVVKGAATGKLFHSAEDEERQRRGLSPLIVEDAGRPTLADAFERELARGGPLPLPLPTQAKAPAAKASPAKAPPAKAPAKLARAKPAAKSAKKAGPRPAAKVKPRAKASAPAGKSAARAGRRPPRGGAAPKKHAGRRR